MKQRRTGCTEMKAASGSPRHSDSKIRALHHCAILPLRGSREGTEAGHEWAERGCGGPAVE